MKTNRRSFIKGALGGIAAAVLAPVLPLLANEKSDLERALKKGDSIAVEQLSSTEGFVVQKFTPRNTDRIYTEKGYWFVELPCYALLAVAGEKVIIATNSLVECLELRVIDVTFISNESIKVRLGEV